MSGGVGLHCDITLNADDYPLISHYDGINKDLLLTSFNGSSWGTEILDSAGDVGMYSSIGLHPSTTTYISYYDASNADLKCAYYDVDYWHIDTIDSYGDVGSYCSLSMNWSHYPSISYYDDTYGSGQLKWAKYLGAPGWVTSVIDDYGVGTYSSNDGTISNHFVYYDYAQNNLLYAQYTGSSWIYQTIQQDRIPGGTSVVEDTYGIPHACYFDPTSKILFYSTSSTGWNEEIVDPSGTARWFASIDLDSNEYPHIAYLNQTYGDLMYAYWTGSSWLIENVDQTGQVGYFCSLMLDSNDCPHIAYHDLNNSTLKYATRTSVNNHEEEQISVSCPISLAIEPNPVSDLFRVNYSNPIGSQASIDIYDLFGRRTAHHNLGYIESGEHVVNLDSSGYPEGIYIVRLTSESQITSIGKLVICR